MNEYLLIILILLSVVLLSSGRTSKRSLPCGFGTCRTTVSELKAIKLVTGINYLIKAAIASNDYILVKIGKPFPSNHDNPSLLELTTNQTLDSYLQ